MTRDEVFAAVMRVEGALGDRAAARALENELYRDVMLAISKGAPNPADLAKIVRQTLLFKLSEVARMPEASADWTKEPPTQPGYYWVRAAGAPEVVHVSSFAVADDFGLVVWTVGGDDWLRMRECEGWRWWPIALVVPHYESEW